MYGQRTRATSGGYRSWRVRMHHRQRLVLWRVLTSDLTLKRDMDRLAPLPPFTTKWAVNCELKTILWYNCYGLSRGIPSRSAIFAKSINDRALIFRIM